MLNQETKKISWYNYSVSMKSCQCLVPFSWTYISTVGVLKLLAHINLKNVGNRLKLWLMLSRMNFIFSDRWREYSCHFKMNLLILKWMQQQLHNTYFLHCTFGLDTMVEVSFPRSNSRWSISLKFKPANLKNYYLGCWLRKSGGRSSALVPHGEAAKKL